MAVMGALSNLTCIVVKCLAVGNPMRSILPILGYDTIFWHFFSIYKIGETFGMIFNQGDINSVIFKDAEGCYQFHGFDSYVYRCQL